MFKFKFLTSLIIFSFLLILTSFVKNQTREIELLKIPYNNIKLENYSKDQITKDNKELLDYFNNNSSAYMT